MQLVTEIINAILTILGVITALVLFLFFPYAIGVLVILHFINQILIKCKSS